VPIHAADEVDPNIDPSSLFSPESEENPAELWRPVTPEPPPGAGASARPVTVAQAPRRKITPAAWIGVALLVVAAVVSASILGGFWRTAPPSSASAPPDSSATASATGSSQGTGVPATHAGDGTITINSAPQGAGVTIDGTPRGITPLTLSIAAGAHTLLLQNGAATRSVPLVVKAGAESSHYIDLPPVATNESTGRLDITSDPPGASVTVDGARRGVTPLLLSSIAPGGHTVVISDGTSSVTRTVRVGAGTTAAVMASLTPAGASAGWLDIDSPIELQILEAGRIIGTTATGRMMLPVGRHDLELVSEPLQFRTPLAVQIAAGKVSAPPVALPDGSVSVNASPWAEVFIDGKPVGTTPLASLAIPIGRHEITWRHPQFGERKQTVTVTAGTPLRLGIDLRK